MLLLLSFAGCEDKPTEQVTPKIFGERTCYVNVSGMRYFVVAGRSMKIINITKDSLEVLKLIEGRESK